MIYSSEKKKYYKIKKEKWTVSFYSKFAVERDNHVDDGLWKLWQLLNVPEIGY